MSIIEIKNNYAKGLGYESFEHLIYMSEPSIIDNHVESLMDLAICKWIEYTKQK